MQPSPFQKLTEHLREKFTKEEDLQMTALVIAANHQYNAMIKISETKLHGIGAEYAKESVSISDELANKILNDIGVQ